MKQLILSTKGIFLLMLWLGLSLTTTGQESKSFYKQPYKTRNSGSFNKGDLILSFGYGFPNVGIGKYNLPGFKTNSVGIGPIYFKGEYGVMAEVGVGAYMAGSTARVIYGNNKEYRDRITAVSFGALGYYHFNKLIPVKALDVYAGLGLGVRVRNTNYDGNFTTIPNLVTTDVLPVFAAGARYYFSDHFGVYAEGRYDGMSIANLGVSFRF